MRPQSHSQNLHPGDRTNTNTAAHSSDADLNTHNTGEQQLNSEALINQCDQINNPSSEYPRAGGQCAQNAVDASTNHGQIDNYEVVSNTNYNRPDVGHSKPNGQIPLRYEQQETQEIISTFFIHCYT